MMTSVEPPPMTMGTVPIGRPRRSLTAPAPWPMRRPRIRTPARSASSAVTPSGAAMSHGWRVDSANRLTVSVVLEIRPRKPVQGVAHRDPVGLQGHIGGRGLVARPVQLLDGRVSPELHASGAADQSQARPAARPARRGRGLRLGRRPRPGLGPRHVSGAGRSAGVVGGTLSSAMRRLRSCGCHPGRAGTPGTAPGLVMVGPRSASGAERTPACLAQLATAASGAEVPVGHRLAAMHEDPGPRRGRPRATPGPPVGATPREPPRTRSRRLAARAARSRRSSGRWCWSRS